MLNQINKLMKEAHNIQPFFKKPPELSDTRSQIVSVSKINDRRIAILWWPSLCPDSLAWSSSTCCHLEGASLSGRLECMEAAMTLNYIYTDNLWISWNNSKGRFQVQGSRLLKSLGPQVIVDDIIRTEGLVTIVEALLGDKLTESRNEQRYWRKQKRRIL